MARLVYSMHVSLDGYVEDADGDIDFSAPADDVHAAANDQARRTAAFLYGRRLYEVMDDYWTTAAARDDVPAIEADFARAYVATPRFVFSDTLATAGAGGGWGRRADARDTVARLKRDLDGQLDIGGAGLAHSMLDLVDEFVPVVFPVVVGGGRPYWPETRLDLDLVDHHTFASGVVRLRYVRAG